jgi:hypothetical protein
MSKTYELDDKLVEDLTRLKYLLDVKSEARVIVRAVALLKLLEKEKDKRGYIRYIGLDGGLNAVNIVGTV